MKKKIRVANELQKTSEVYRERMEMFKQVDEYHNQDVRQLSLDMYKKLTKVLIGYDDQNTLYATLIALAQIAASTVYSLYLTRGEDHLPAFGQLLNESMDDLESIPEIQAITNVVDHIRKAGKQ